MKTAKLSDIAGIVAKIAPSTLAEHWDNPGLQVGDPAAEIRRIMVALDATPSTVASAIDNECQLLLTHHPLIFKPQKSIIASTPQGRIIHQAIRNNLSIFSMHTNYDIAAGGMNDLLAEKLRLQGCVPLQETSAQELLKVVVFVPEGHLDEMRAALLPLAVNLGAYRDCSFSVSGEGTFTPLEGAKPFIGSIGKAERTAEYRLEFMVSRPLLPKVIKALLAAHPYEEPAFDIYPLLNEGIQYGLGRIGRLAAPVTVSGFVAVVADLLGMRILRYTGTPDRMVKKVAVCSGSGASLLHAAVRAGADVLLTGDVKYHEARDAEDQGIALIDAGHFHTEIIMVQAVCKRIGQMLEDAGFEGCEAVPCAVEADPFRVYQV